MTPDAVSGKPTWLAGALPDRHAPHESWDNAKAACNCTRLSRHARLRNLRLGWLTTGPASDYELTRAWASAIREWAPWCIGLTWRSHREPEGFAYVMFEDRVPNDCLAEVSTEAPLTGEDQHLDDGIGRLYVERILEIYRVALI